MMEKFYMSIYQKLVLLINLCIVILLPLNVHAWVTPWGAASVDGEGNLTGVTKFTHEPSGTSIFEIDVLGNVTGFPNDTSKQNVLQGEIYFGRSGASNDFIVQTESGVTPVGPASARTAMGVAIGSDIQAYDVDTAKVNVDRTWTADQNFAGKTQANEILGGASTYGISNDMTLDDSVYLSGRVGELSASVSPIILLPALSGVTPMVIITDVTIIDDDSGITIFSSADNIRQGVGTNHTSGGTIFINSGNTGFVIVLKAMSYGGTIDWKVWSCDAAAVFRP